ncbi:MFS transporter [Streptosporangium sandarakinum]
MRREAAEAITWLWRRHGLREVTAAVMVLNLLGGAFLIPLIVLVGERGGDARVTGTVLAGLGIGGLTGALLSGRISRLLPPGRLLLAVVTVFGAALAATALPWGAWWPMIPLMFITLSTPSLNVVMDVVVTRMVPEAMLGRMGAVLSMGGMALKPLGPVLGGALAAALGGAAALIVLGGLLGLTAAVAALSPQLRHFTGEASTAGDDTSTDDKAPRTLA